MCDGGGGGGLQVADGAAGRKDVGVLLRLRADVTFRGTKQASG